MAESRYQKVQLACAVDGLFPIPQHSSAFKDDVPNSLRMAVFMGGELVALEKVKRGKSRNVLSFSFYHDRDFNYETDSVPHSQILDLFMQVTEKLPEHTNRSQLALESAYMCNPPTLRISTPLFNRKLLESETRPYSQGFTLCETEQPTISEDSMNTLLQGLKHTIVFMLLGSTVELGIREILAIGCVSISGITSKISANGSKSLLVPVRNFGALFARSCEMSTAIKIGLSAHPITEKELQSEFNEAIGSQTKLENGSIRDGRASIFPASITKDSVAWSTSLVHGHLTKFPQLLLQVLVRSDWRFTNSDARDVYALVQDFRVRRAKFIELRDAIIAECELLKKGQGIDTVLALSFPDDPSASCEQLPQPSSESPSPYVLHPGELGGLDTPESDLKDERSTESQSMEAGQVCIHATIDRDNVDARELLKATHKSFQDVLKKARTYKQGHLCIPVKATDGGIMTDQPQQPNSSMPCDPFGSNGQPSRLMTLSLDNIEFEFDLHGTPDKIRVNMDLPAIQPVGQPPAPSTPSKRISTGPPETDGGARRLALHPFARHIVGLYQRVPKLADKPMVQQILLGFRHALSSKRDDIARSLFSTVFQAWQREAGARKLIEQGNPEQLDNLIEYARKRDMQLLRNVIAGFTARDLHGSMYGGSSDIDSLAEKSSRGAPSSSHFGKSTVVNNEPTTLPDLIRSVMLRPDNLSTMSYLGQRDMDTIHESSTASTGTAAEIDPEVNGVQGTDEGKDSKENENEKEYDDEEYEEDEADEEDEEEERRLRANAAEATRLIEGSD